MKRAVFLDRDGTLNRNVWNPATGAYESPLYPEQMELVAGAASALKLLRDAGFLLVLVSNQPNAAKGKTTARAMDAIHARFEYLLREEGIILDAVYYCFHHPEFTGPCVCRKPSPYFLFHMRDKFGVDLAASWMMGDRITDVQCGLAAGVKTVFLSKINPAETSIGLAAPDVWAAAQMIVEHHAVRAMGLRVSI